MELVEPSLIAPTSPSSLDGCDNHGPYDTPAPDAVATDIVAVIDMGVYEMDHSGISEVVNIVQVSSLNGSRD